MVVFSAKSQPLSPTPEKKHFPIVRIESQNRKSICTAFVINDKQAITAAHCVEKELSLFSFLMPEDKFDVYNSEGTKTTAVATVEEIADETSDIAILKGDFKNFEKLNVRKQYNLVLKEPLLACGYPGGFKQLQCTYGVYAGTSYFSGLMTGYLAKGMSGGPVIDMNDEVVGVNSRRLQNGLSMFAIIFGIIPME
jgi:S1-C subfamily serine protease